MYGRTNASIRNRKSQAKDHGGTVTGSIQLKIPERYNTRRQYERPRCDTLANFGTARGKIKANRFRKPVLIRSQKKYAIKELEILAVAWG